MIHITENRNRKFWKMLIKIGSSYVFYIFCKDLCMSILCLNYNKVERDQYSLESTKLVFKLDWISKLLDILLLVSENWDRWAHSKLL